MLECSAVRAFVSLWYVDRQGGFISVDKRRVPIGDHQIDGRSRLDKSDSGGCDE